MRARVELLREFSVPLILGVLAALVWANVDYHGYERFLNRGLGAGLTFHFLVNDLFMAFFFAIAAVEITQACLPGGDLNPPSRALNPLLATLGGVVGPVAVYLGLNKIIGSPELLAGWGIPTATDIALAWLAARLVFGRNHAAVSFLLLLAIVDDAIGLAIIAVFYPDPAVSPAPAWLGLTTVGMLFAYALRRAGARNYWPYLLLGGSLSWAGLFRAHLHPALALVFIVPFLPHAPRERAHLFEEEPGEPSPLNRFEQDWKVFVDFGLFLFGLANAGVPFSQVGTATWLVLAGLALGKTIGILAFGLLGVALGLRLPAGMRWRELAVAGLLAGIGFTVAIFIAGEAFVDPVIEAQAKMGAILSVVIIGVGALVGKALGVERVR